MAKVITITNNKGGTGKTTTAVNLAAALRRHGFDVLLIDYDGQANATKTLRIPTDGGTVYDTMNDTHTPFVAAARLMNPDGQAGALDVLPSCRDVAALETELASKPDRLTRFAAVVDKYRDKYDVILIDTPPTLGLLSLSALYAADELIITVQPEFLAVAGLLSLTDAVEVVRGNRGVELPARVLFTQFDRRKGLHRLTAEQVEGAGFQTYATRIRENVALAEAPAVGSDVFSYAPRSNGAADYGAFADEFLNTTKLAHVKHHAKR